MFLISDVPALRYVTIKHEKNQKYCLVLRKYLKLLKKKSC